MESLAPFLQGTCTPYNMPVYPGAQRIIAKARFQAGRFWKRGKAFHEKAGLLIPSVGND